MIVNGLIIGGSVALAALGGYAVWLWLRRDDRRAGFAQDEHPGFGDITPETVHKAPWPPAQPPAVTLHGAAQERRTGYYVAGRDWPAMDSGIPVEDLLNALERIPETSPAAPAPPGAEQGTAVAAGGSPPPASPPPLPDPAYAAAHPGCWPLTWLQDDQFVTDWTARALAETEALVKASYHKPLDGA